MDKSRKNQTRSETLSMPCQYKKKGGKGGKKEDGVEKSTKNLTSLS